MTHRPTTQLFALLAVLTLAALASPVVAAPGGEIPPKSMTLGSSGELLELRAGTYGELFPGGDATAADASVLALDIVVDDERSHLLVPGTESSALERSPQLVHDEAVGISYLLWESVVHGVHPLLQVRSFDGREWSELQTIVGGVFSSKGEPQLVVTRDGHGEGEMAIERTILHVLWWEQVGGAVEKRYAPLVIENGAFTDAQPIFDLTATFTKSNRPLDSAFESLLRVQEGPNADSLVAGFLDAEGRITSLRLGVMPMALGQLADRVVEAIDSLPYNASDETILRTIEAVLEAEGDELHPALLALIELELGDVLRSLPPHGRAWGLGEKARGQIVWIGARLRSHGLAETSEIEMLGVDGALGAHHFKVSRIASWDEPEAGNEPKLFLSRDGDNALVAWAVEGAVEYRETRTDGTWSETRRLGLGDGLELQGALELLRLKVHDR